MKSEIEQFNKLRFPPPAKTFETIKFNLSEKRPTLTYAQAKSVVDKYDRFFSGTSNSSLARSRYNVDNPVKLCEFIPRRCTEISQDISLSIDKSSSSGQKYSDYNRLLGCYLRRGEYKNIILLMQKLQQQNQFIGILSIFAFVSAILLKDDSNEFNFFQLIEKQLVNNREDIKHFYHIIDELNLLSEGNDKNYPAPLIDLNFLDVPRLKDILSFRQHIFPTIQLAARYFRASDRIFDLSQLLNNISTKLPPLIPIGEGFLGIPPKDPQTILNFGSSLSAASNSAAQKPSNYRQKNQSNRNRSRTPIKSKESGEVLALISESKWDQAIALSTEVLSKNPKDSEMYLHRAFSLYHISKVEDALNDCTISLSIRKTDKALRMRASFWLQLGEVDLCKEDLQMMDEKSIYNNLFKQNNKNRLNSPSSNRGKNARNSPKGGNSKRVNFDGSKS